MADGTFLNPPPRRRELIRAVPERQPPAVDYAAQIRQQYYINVAVGADPPVP